MTDDTSSEAEVRQLIGEAEEHGRHRRYAAAAQCLERAAAAGDVNDRAQIWMRAGEMWVEDGNRVAAGRCYLQASELLDGPAKIDCMFTCWRAYINGIVRDEWECGFEWRGDLEEHRDDHASHDRAIDTYRREATSVLAAILRIPGTSRSEVLGRAEQEYVRLKNQGGWGARRCRAIIDSVNRDNERSHESG